MTEVTSTYQLPSPDLTDTPNVPSDMQALAQAVESALIPIDARARVAQIICGEIAGGFGLVTVTLPFQPQFVRFVTQDTGPPVGSNGVVATFNHGVLGRAVDGSIYQYNTGIRVTSSGFSERRTNRNSCAGLMVDDSTISGEGIGNLTATGFTLNILTLTTNSFFWEAHE